MACIGTHKDNTENADLEKPKIMSTVFLHYTMDIIQLQGGKKLI